MLRFKQFLILEDTTVTNRDYLISIYGKENAEKMISSIRQREKELGGTEQYLKYADTYRSVSNQQRDRLSKAGLNPDLFDDPHFESERDSIPKAASGMDDLQISTFTTFAVPDYSDKNLDRPVDVNAVEMKPSPTLVAAGFKNTVPLATGSLVGNKPKNVRGTINVDKSSGDRWMADDKDLVYMMNRGGSMLARKYDVIGHELTHTAQPDWNYSTAGRTPLPNTEYKSTEPASEETLKRRIYTQNAFEPAARMSELKHLYYARTRNLLPANMTADDKTKFKSWYDTSDIRSPEFDDTVQLIDTPEGGELFNRVTKANNSRNQNQEMA
jgi:hypothetical protein